jgi:hypothetical protein
MTARFHATLSLQLKLKLIVGEASLVFTELKNNDITKENMVRIYMCRPSYE